MNTRKRQLGDLGLCVGQVGRSWRSTEDDDGHVLCARLDRGDDPLLAGASDDRSDVGHDCGLTPFAAAVGVLEQEAFYSHRVTAARREAIGCLHGTELAWLVKWAG